MKIRQAFRLSILIAFIVLNNNINIIGSNKSGEKLTKWTEGYIDIHHINTGKGVATFSILPDGTTLLIDAGESHRPPSPREAPQKPDNSRSSGEWISRYIKNVLDTHSLEKLNYILLTHFHGDHMGGVNSNNKYSAQGTYKLSGITEVGENIAFDKIIDRAWPTYDWPTPLNNASIENYKNFLNWQKENNKIEIQKIQVGKNDQISLVNNPKHYKTFEVRNIAANGMVWTGVGNNFRNHFPLIETLKEEDYPDENMLSIAIRISYGKFDYFTGGDLIGNPSPGDPEWHDIETPVGHVVGPVEVNVTNHHAHYNSQNENFLKSLRPRVHIIPSWVVNHPAPSTLERLLSNKLYPGPRDIFATNLMENTKIFIGQNSESIANNHGHIVVRVLPKGEQFYIYILDDSNEDFKVKSKYGPYSCN